MFWRAVDATGADTLGGRRLRMGAPRVGWPTDRVGADDVSEKVRRRVSSAGTWEARVVVVPEAAGTRMRPGTGKRLWPVQGLSCEPCRLRRPELLTTLIPDRRHAGQVPDP